MSRLISAAGPRLLASPALRAYLGILARFVRRALRVRALARLRIIYPPEDGEAATHDGHGRCSFVEGKDAEENDGKLVHVCDHHEGGGGDHVLQPDPRVANSQAVEAGDDEVGHAVQRQRPEGTAPPRMLPPDHCKHKRGRRTDGVVEHHHHGFGHVHRAVRHEVSLHDALEDGEYHVHHDGARAHKGELQVIRLVDGHAGDDGDEAEDGMCGRDKGNPKHALDEHGEDGRNVAADHDGAECRKLHGKHGAREHAHE
mmetsp:Transcript_19977/g.58992  ORF Transcript_19977/g.58992 Transcript_19977/m.58992 type:complete len:257 (+) Transcript_19977:202-972(+)|eukprot:CAMPEP_0206034706 /NCGR_PEP_ID=MMETSP1466-20131121/1547_1 /ASSEMBLY_ACC=CAM_ASM_001126 /TAXON_ID=44452 /ORGANISM="Pavlova gyrans, Strain CCMP608" /LENGTH=256 /DNA_ID=CAMNT_0053409025 /DNA_START=131 /DNA_END=901 /DNA_ORIENTATION=-